MPHMPYCAVVWGNVFETNPNNQNAGKSCVTASEPWVCVFACHSSAFAVPSCSTCIQSSELDGTGAKRRSRQMCEAALSADETEVFLVVLDCVL